MDIRSLMRVQLRVQESCTHIESLNEMPLTDTAIRQLKAKNKNYKVSDGEGLTLLVRPSGTKSWQWRYRFLGKEKTLTIGNYPTTGLKEARIKKKEAQLTLSNLCDPSAEKQLFKSEIKRLHDGKFKTIANDWFENQKSNWSEKYAKKTNQTLSNWIYPKLNDIPVALITSRTLLDVLRDMERAGIGETTRKMKGILENIFAFAIVEGHIENNPASGLQKALKAVPRVTHQRALSAKKIGHFVHKIESDNGHPVIRLSLLLLLHTNVRTNDVRLAEWEDFDLKEKIWTIPANKIKMKTEHKVPLTKQSIKILTRLKELTGHQNWISKSPNTIDKPMSENAMLNLLKRIKMDKHTTVHGLRATASTFLNEKGFRPDVIESQLAHVESNQVRKAYNHAKYWDERVEMTNYWSTHISKEQSKFNM